MSIELNDELCRRYYKAGYNSSPPLIRECKLFKGLTWLPYNFNGKETRYFCKEWIEETIQKCGQ